jgi:hypothetical protein
MKYKTFVRLRLGVPVTLAAGGVAGVVATNSAADSKPTPQPIKSAAPAPKKTDTQPTAQAGTQKGVALTGKRATPSELSDVDKEVIRLRDRPLSTGINDGTATKFRSKNGAVVIELRADTAKGSTTWNRAKVDLDGDKQFDEKWDFDGPAVTRKVSPSDDGVTYSEVYKLQNKQWVLAATGGATPTPTTVVSAQSTVAGSVTTIASSAATTAVATAGTGRSIDATVFALLKSPLSNGVDDGGSLKYRVKNNPAVIELRSDTAKGFKTWNRVKLDLDGDKNVDEKWTIDASGVIERQVSPADDNTYTEKYKLTANQWVKE